MRVEPYTTGSIVHVVKRGARGMDIVTDDIDRIRFMRSLFLLNDKYQSTNWHRETVGLRLFERPKYWPERDPLVHILAWTLMPNHFHLLLQEREEGGITKFMQRIGGSMSLCFNLKYESRGSIFQGSYKAKTVDDDSYLRYLSFYIHIKNVLELYPGGLRAALKDFDKAWDWATNYLFSSLVSYESGNNFVILDDVGGLIANTHKQNCTKSEAFEMLKSYFEKLEVPTNNRLEELLLE